MDNETKELEKNTEEQKAPTPKLRTKTGTQTKIIILLGFISILALILSSYAVYVLNKDERIESEQIISSLLTKGHDFYDNGKFEEAISTYSVMIDNFGNTQSLWLRDYFLDALVGRAFSRLVFAKQIWKTSGDETKAKELLTLSLRDTDESLKIDPNNSISLGNKGYALFLLNGEDAATPSLMLALVLGRKALRDGELADADLFPLPQDVAFKKLIDRLWINVSNRKIELILSPSN